MKLAISLSLIRHHTIEECETVGVNLPDYLRICGSYSGDCEEAILWSIRPYSQQELS
jgi:hypothetical protein